MATIKIRDNMHRIERMGNRTNSLTPFKRANPSYELTLADAFKSLFKNQVLPTRSYNPPQPAMIQLIVCCSAPGTWYDSKIDRLLVPCWGMGPKADSFGAQKENLLLPFLLIEMTLYDDRRIPKQFKQLNLR